MSLKSTRRNFVKKSLAMPMVAAAAGSLVMAGLVNAQGTGGTASTSTHDPNNCQKTLGQGNCDPARDENNKVIPGKWRCDGGPKPEHGGGWTCRAWCTTEQGGTVTCEENDVFIE